MEERKVVSPWIALIPVVFLVASLSLGILVWGIDAHIPLFTSAIVAALIAIFVLKIKWKDIEEGLVDTIKLAMVAVIILMIIGMVIGTWILSGVVPTMIYFGLQILSPSIFLVATLLITSIVSLATGSSWTTAGTVGIALMGVGISLGVPVPMIGGAIISGAYFGDKMSPLSDTTNLAPAMTGAQLFDHVKHMLYTAVPAYVISIIFFLILGFGYAGQQMDASVISEINAGLAGNFNLSPWLLLVPVIVILIVVKKVPAILGLFAGAVLGGIAAMVFQGAGIADVIDAMHYGYASESGIAVVDDLLSRGGLDSMMWTVSLILCAMIFGGVMEKTGMLQSLAFQILKLAKGTGSLVLTTMVTAVFVNIVAADQYLSLVVPGRMFKEVYDGKKLKPENLSRVLEGSGTLSSPLIPWNTCGAFMIGTLGLAPWTYVPFCIFNLTTPVVVALYGFTGFSMTKVDDKEAVKA